MSDIWLLILLGTITTYATRFGGYLAMSRVRNISPRVNAVLNAVPAAVLPTIIVPALMDGNWVERAVLVICCFLALRLSLLATVCAGTAMVIAARAVGLG